MRQGRGDKGLGFIRPADEYTFIITSGYPGDMRFMLGACLPWRSWTRGDLSVTPETSHVLGHVVKYTPYTCHLNGNFLFVFPSLYHDFPV